MKARQSPMKVAVFFMSQCWFYHLDLHAQSSNDTVKDTNAGRNSPILYFRDIRLSRLCTFCQFSLRHLGLLASILYNLPRIKRVSSLFSSSPFGCTLLAELCIKHGIIVNDFVIVCLHNKPPLF